MTIEINSSEKLKRHSGTERSVLKLLNAAMEIPLARRMESKQIHGAQEERPPGRHEEENQRHEECLLLPNDQNLSTSNSH